MIRLAALLQIKHKERVETKLVREESLTGGDVLLDLVESLKFDEGVHVLLFAGRASGWEWLTVEIVDRTSVGELSTPCLVL
jgi:hypothetical protein